MCNASSGTWEMLKIRGEGGMEVSIVSRKFEGEDFGSIPAKILGERGPSRCPPPLSSNPQRCLFLPTALERKTPKYLRLKWLQVSLNDIFP